MTTAQLVLSGATRETQATVTTPIKYGAIVAVVALVVWLIVSLRK